MKNYISEKGQSLVEVIIALSVAVLVVIAFTNATIGAVRNAQYARNQNQATKYAQETLEIIRAIRDQDETGKVNTGKWSDLWATNQTTAQCYLLNTTTFQLTSKSDCSDSTSEAITGTVFSRKIRVTNPSGNTERKEITVNVYWQDNKGRHQAESVTYLTKWQQ